MYLRRERIRSDPHASSHQRVSITSEPGGVLPMMSGAAAVARRTAITNTARDAKLAAVYHDHHGGLCSFWGLHSLLQDCGIALTPSALTEYLKSVTGIDFHDSQNTAPLTLAKFKELISLIERDAPDEAELDNQSVTEVVKEFCDGRSSPADELNRYLKQFDVQIDNLPPEANSDTVEAEDMVAMIMGRPRPKNLPPVSSRSPSLMAPSPASLNGGRNRPSIARPRQSIANLRISTVPSVSRPLLAVGSRSGDQHHSSAAVAAPTALMRRQAQNSEVSRQRRANSDYPEIDWGGSGADNVSMELVAIPTELVATSPSTSPLSGHRKKYPKPWKARPQSPSRAMQPTALQKYRGAKMTKEQLLEELSIMKLKHVRRDLLGELATVLQIPLVTPCSPSASPPRRDRHSPEPVSEPVPSAASAQQMEKWTRK